MFYRGFISLFCAVVLAASLSACESQADIASRNVSKAADQFEVSRRIIFYNGITGEHIMSIQGLCSLGNHDKAREITVTCKTAPGEYKKHFLGLSDNVTFFAEQIDAKSVSAFQYRIIFNPKAVIPEIEMSR